MEKLANLTQTNINNGVLNGMLLNTDISDVQEYIKQFHQQTEELTIKDFEQPNPNMASNDEKVVSSADPQSGITSLGLRLDDSIQPPLPQQKQQQPFSTDLKTWMRHTIPHRTLSSTDNTISTTNPPYQNDTAVSGDIETWLNDWAKSLSEQPPPTSLDD